MTEFLNNSPKESEVPADDSTYNGYTEATLYRVIDRLNQSSGSRLSEYVTGFSLEDPKATGRAMLDCSIVRGKYGLPDVNVAVNSPAWYESFLRDRAMEDGIEIVHRAECGDFFTRFPNAAAAYFDENKRAGVTIDKNDYLTYVQSIRYLEHEVIHALQFKRTPSMPIEIMEYEAYMAEGDITNLYYTFDRANSSVMAWYKQISEKEGMPVVPEWDNPEYFIREVDGVMFDNLSEIKTAALMRVHKKLKQHQSQSTDDVAYEIDLGDMREDLYRFEVRPIE